MIAIVNIDKNPRKSGAHEYAVMINTTRLFTFEHNREEPLDICLAKAARAAAVYEAMRMRGVKR